MFHSPALSQKTWKRQVVVAFLRKGSNAGREIRPRLRHTEGEPLNVKCAKMKRDVVRLAKARNIEIDD
jgi:hypothetical protein